MYGGKTNIVDDIKHQFRYGTNLTRLIIINIGVFVVAKLLILIGDFLLASGIGNNIVIQLMLPAEFSILLKRPWTIITNIFLHLSLWHILFNMLVLYWFGRIFEDLIGTSKIIPVFILGGLMGSACFLLAYNTFPSLKGVTHIAMLHGASAGVMAIVLATATIAPNYVINLLFVGPVKLMWIAAFYVAMDILLIPEGNIGGRIAHLGGALMGYLYIIQLRQGRDWANSLLNLWDKTIAIFQKKPKQKVVFKQTEKEKKAHQNKKSSNTQDSKKADTSRQHKIDEILDKISRSGYNSLSKEEKEFLFKISKED